MNSFNSINEILQSQNASVKKRFLHMYKAANAGHVGCSLSCTELLIIAKLHWMKPDDHLVLSKGHAAAVLYSVLAEAGELSKDDIATFYKDGTYLSAHPPANKIKSIPFATGSLGHGLSLAAGLAYASHLKNDAKKTFCITSDGELNEGSSWEAAMFIAHHRLTNLFWMIDRNKIQGFGRTEDVMQLEPLADKLKAFGFETVVCEGHDFEKLDAVYKNYSSTKPLAIIADTVKGNGMFELADTVDCHYLPMTDSQFEKMITQY
jgi:transketolase